MTGAAAAEGADEESRLPLRLKTPRQQLTKGMEHIRPYVAIPGPPPPPPPPPPQGEDAYGVPARYEPVRQPATGPRDAHQKRSDPFQFGTRYLQEGDDIFAHNAWDHVEADAQYGEFIEQQTLFQRANPVSEWDKKRFNDQPEKWWDRFYSHHQANFFKDRKWLVQEFPVLGQVTQADHGPVTVLEVGAGAGNTAFPVLAHNRNPRLRLHACDYSAKAIDLIRSQEAYTAQGSPAALRADVWDAAGPGLPPGLGPASVDVVVMIFVFSALAPDQWARAVANASALLKPGGELLFRDYARGDLAQVRFKKGRYLADNFYVRGDGTRVYFFDEPELRDIWSAAGFEIPHLAVDRRMLVNRQRKLKMYRCWIQARFRKPVRAEGPESPAREHS